MKNFIKSFVTVFLVIMAFLTIIVGIFYIKETWDESAWNGGICSRCGGEYHFANASNYRGYTHYYYICENCEKVIDLNSPQ